MLLYDEDIYKWLKHSLNLKTEKGIRASIERLCVQMKKDKDKLNSYVPNCDTYQKSSLRYLNDLYSVASKAEY